jgi:hypothetical protein
MKTIYVIRWKSTVNGRAGKGTKLFTRADGEQLIEELNREYPQILHELAEADPARSEIEATSDSGSKPFTTETIEMAEVQ